VKECSQVTRLGQKAAATAKKPSDRNIKHSGGRFSFQMEKKRETGRFIDAGQSLAKSPGNTLIICFSPKVESQVN
jgi:hypothetical protein